MSATKPPVQNLQSLFDQNGSPMKWKCLNYTGVIGNKYLFWSQSLYNPGVFEYRFDIILTYSTKVVVAIYTPRARGLSSSWRTSSIDQKNSPKKKAIFELTFGDFFDFSTSVLPHTYRVLAQTSHICYVHPIVLVYKILAQYLFGNLKNFLVKKNFQKNSKKFSTFLTPKKKPFFGKKIFFFEKKNFLIGIWH